jgi:AcrR family transcriptional regulator
MTSETVDRRTRLTPEREAELFGVVMEVLREVGYDALTMDAVAARAKTSKATLYRQWQGKPLLVISALRHLRPIYLGGEDTGTLTGDMHSVARHLSQFAEQDSVLLASLSQAAMANPDLGQALREVLIRPDREAFDAIVRRAVERGELDHFPAATGFLSPILVHAVLQRPLCEGVPADLEYLTAVVDTVILPALHHS